MIEPNDHPIAYFSAEFAIDSELPTYAGGLGILAGDYMNAAARMNLPVVGIGVLYKGKPFIQRISENGTELKRDSEFDHDASFLRPVLKEGIPLKVQLKTPEGDVFIKAYQLLLSEKTVLYFLSTDVDGNPPNWMEDMNTLYRGSMDSQIRQQMVLGIGGVKLIHALALRPSCYHLNEGRPAFAVWEITRKLMEEERLDFDSAFTEAKKLIVYTNHTMVSAGNPLYPKTNVIHWITPYSKDLQASPEQLLNGGEINDQFSISDFAMSSSGVQSAVSTGHKECLLRDYPTFNWKAVTNGIDLVRWQDSDFQEKEKSPESVWNLHMAKKRELAQTVKERTGIEYDPHQLVITWARRLAEYKQPMLIFRDVSKLKSIISTSNRPVQFLFAGNSHASDIQAEHIIQDLIKLFSTELFGHAIFVPDYNIALANHLTSGSDVWLNTPMVNWEACGTSGMKAMSNGVLNCTILDGWTKEVDWSAMGWTLSSEKTDESFYTVLEKEIIPAYYEQDQSGISISWINRMKKSIIHSKNFSAERMINDYIKYLYPNVIFHS